MTRQPVLYTDKANGKFMGVCAGIADRFGWDPTFVRVGVGIATMMPHLHWIVLAYIAAGLIANDKISNDRRNGDYQ